MKFIKFLIVFLFCGFNVYSQNIDIVIDIDSVYQEGMLIYRNSKSSWLGNEILIKPLQEKDLVKDLGGYLSYPMGDITHFIFYNKKNRVIAETYFDSTFKAYVEHISFNERDFNEVEKFYIRIKQATLEFQQKDSTIKYYDNTGMNVVPILFKNKIKVYMLTAPSIYGQVILGNDYVLEFDENIKNPKLYDIHKTIVPIPYAKDTIQTQSYHTHTDEMGALPSPTDIAIVFLYGELAGWTQHLIYSKELTTILNIKTKKMQVGRTQPLEGIKQEKE
jgi:phage pi2 protein 07